MASIPDGYKELFYAAAADLKTLLWSEREEDAKIVQKGLLLYRQGLVTNMRIEDDHVTAVVQDVTPVHVKLDLNFLQVSTCTCPAGGFCRHQLAVFFHFYSQVDSVTDWVEDWRSPLKEKKSAQDWGLKKAKDLLKTERAIKPDYELWVKNFEASFTSIFKEKPYVKPHLVTDLFYAYSRKIKAAAPLEHEWKRLYFLIASLHSFHHLLQLTKEMDHSEIEINRHYAELFFSIIEEIEDHLKKLSINAMPFAFDEFIEKLKNDAFYLLDDSLGIRFERNVLYIKLWMDLFKKKSWREEEIKKINGHWQDGPGHSLINGFIHQKIMLGEDSTAFRQVQELKEEAAPYLPIWIKYWVDRNEWKRTGPFADYFAGILNDHLHSLNDSNERMNFTKWAIHSLMPYIKKTNKYDLYEKLLAQSLPYSYWTYEDFLYTSGLYEKWADLQIYIGLDIDSIPADRLKYLQKEEPRVLLPIYHQSVQRHIAMKNRGNYREAVKQLKKLRTLYRKLKQQKDWEQFLEILLEKTKRLRAFQEECERGKLIHA